MKEIIHFLTEADEIDERNDKMIHQDEGATGQQKQKQHETPE